MRRFYLVIAAVLAGSPAFAQESLPSMTLDQKIIGQDASSRFSQDARPTFNYNNTYLNDTLSLQYQNILLEKMILRQSAIARTEKSFIDVGIPFNQPAPPRGICEQIPVNVPCYKAYPDLYPGAVADVGQIEDGALLTDASFGSEATSTRAAAAAAAKKETPAEPVAEPIAYKWAEITCAGGRCQAVLAKDGARQTVQMGDELDDNITVKKITATGVDVSRHGKVESLQAALAPSRGGVGSPKFGGYAGSSASAPKKLSGTLSQKSDQLQDMFGKNGAPTAPSVGNVAPDMNTAAADTPPQAPVISAPQNALITDPGPPLGATGLY